MKALFSNWKRVVGVAAMSGVLLIVLCAGRPAVANRAVPGHTLVPVTAADCTSISIQRQSDGSGGTVIVTTFTFEVKDSEGVVRYSASVGHQLTTGERNSLGTFITNVAVPIANAAENL